MKEFIIKNTNIWKIFLKYYRSDEEIVFLHSSQVTEKEHYSILAHKPYKKVSKYKGQVFFNGEKKKFNFLDAVDLLKDERVERPKNWPFYPELLGFVSYEQDPACFAAYDEVLLFDHRTKLLRVVQFEQTDGQYWLRLNRKKLK
ncbi:hypothetical protein OGZ51_10010 [Lactococcus lactis]|uniref:Anthranilate synthase component I N-terminal domain-containing protein n=1 Tax=Lactococcus lactis TaxID=1358 RepID=A0A9X4NI28_9LACT|nr:hypothetical protein [Lactococcus lactis]MDG4984478.1 hypothetical protein [Lactococcus lactis]